VEWRGWPCRATSGDLGVAVTDLRRHQRLRLGPVVRPTLGTASLSWPIVSRRECLAATMSSLVLAHVGERPQRPLTSPRSPQLLSGRTDRVYRYSAGFVYPSTPNSLESECPRTSGAVFHRCDEQPIDPGLHGPLPEPLET